VDDFGGIKYATDNISVNYKNFSTKKRWTKYRGVIHTIIPEKDIFSLVIYHFEPKV